MGVVFSIDLELLICISELLLPTPVLLLLFVSVLHYAGMNGKFAFIDGYE